MLEIVLEIVKAILMVLGVCVLGVFVYIAILALINKFNRWRKNGCKIKCLCKPHIYEFYWFLHSADWFLHRSGELALKCKKCGKIKKIIVDKESFDTGMWK